MGVLLARVRQVQEAPRQTRDISVSIIINIITIIIISSSSSSTTIIIIRIIIIVIIVPDLAGSADREEPRVRAERAFLDYNVCIYIYIYCM